MTNILDAETVNLVNIEKELLKESGNSKRNIQAKS